MRYQSAVALVEKNAAWTLTTFEGSMYKVLIVMMVWDSYSVEDSKEWLTVHKELEIPFVPFVDLEINLPMERSWKIKSVTWNVEEKYFRCALEDLFCELSIDAPEFEDWQEHFKENNWISAGPYPNDD